MKNNMVKVEINVKNNIIEIMRMNEIDYISLTDLAKQANAELIEMKISQNERLIRLNNIARKQMELLKNNKSFNNLEYIENKVNNKQELPI